MPSFQQPQQQQQHSHHHQQQMDDYPSSNDRDVANVKMENMATDLRKLD